MYPALYAVKSTFSAYPFEIVGFPCRQFLNQEPGENNEILNCVRYVRPGNGFIPNFPLMSKGDVNGPNEQPVYTWMKKACPQPCPYIGETAYISWSPVKVTDITWNWEKFLITRSGRAYKRFSPTTDPHDMVNDIYALIGDEMADRV